MSVSLRKPPATYAGPDWARCAHCGLSGLVGQGPCTACSFPGYGAPAWERVEDAQPGITLRPVSASACPSVICRGLSRHVGTGTCVAPPAPVKPVVSAKSLPADPTTLIEADRILRAQLGVSLRVVRANLRAVRAGASPMHVRAGLAWYKLAQAIARAIDAEFGLTSGTGACLLAAYSPRTRWSDNVRYAWHMGALIGPWSGGVATLDALAGTMAVNHARAIRVAEASMARGASFPTMAATLGQGPKVAAFAWNCHGVETLTTVDVWALRAALKPSWKRGDDMRDAEMGLSRKGVYGALHLAYQAEARMAGVSTAEYQAIIWCAISGFAD